MFSLYELFSFQMRLCRRPQRHGQLVEPLVYNLRSRLQRPAPILVLRSYHIPRFILINISPMVAIRPLPYRPLVDKGRENETHWLRSQKGTSGLCLYDTASQPPSHQMIYNNEPSQRNSTSATHCSIQRQSSSFFIHFLIQAGSCNIFPANLFPLPLCSIPFIPFHLSATYSHSQHVSQVWTYVSAVYISR